MNTFGIELDKRTDEELIKLTTNDRENHQRMTIIAAENELARRRNKSSFIANEIVEKNTQQENSNENSTNNNTSDYYLNSLFSSIKDNNLNTISESQNKDQKEEIIHFDHSSKISTNKTFINFKAIPNNTLQEIEKTPITVKSNAESIIKTKPTKLNLPLSPEPIDLTVENGIRITAFLIDTFILLIICSIFSELSNYIYFHIFYYFGLEMNYQKTAGKYLMRIKVVDSDGNKPNFMNIILRTIFRLTLILDIIIFLKYKVSIHEFISKTKLLKDEQ